METLLTPSESLAFQSFLSSVDHSQPSNDWASYASQFNPHGMRRDDDEISVDPLPPPPQNDSLAKATKDLMSLDAAGWNDGPMSAHPDLQGHHQHLMYTPQMRHHQEQQQQQPLLTQPLHPQHMYSSAHEPFPFLNQKGSFQHHAPSYPQQQYAHAQHHPQQSVALASPTSPELFSYPPPQQHPHLNGHVPQLSRSQSQSSAHGVSTTMPTKRSARSSGARSMSMSNGTPTVTTAATAPRQRTGQPSSQQGRSSQSPHPNGATPSSSKPALLSPSQKKANHIQSEQKRRANIRRGYEALCETVPALREAIREEEDEARLNAAQAAAGLANAKGKAAGKKRASKKKDGEDAGSTSARDKIDGRAGPRSENVVLSKTIDYINDLLSERSNLLARLQKARSMLPPGHPCLLPLSPHPVWEREWKGGEGKLGDEDAEDSEGEPAEGDDDDDSSQAKSRDKRNGVSGDGGSNSG